MGVILVEKLVGMLVLLTCMLWAAAEKPYHDRVGGDEPLPECTGTYKEVVCKHIRKNQQCLLLGDYEFLRDSENRIRIVSNSYACTGQGREG